MWERAYVGAGIGLYDLLAVAGREPAARATATSAAGPRSGWPRRSARRPDRRRPLLGRPGRRRPPHADRRPHRRRPTARPSSTSAQVVGFAAGGRPGRRRAGRLRRERAAACRVAARQVINATATWTDQVQGLAGRGRIRVRASKGIHLVVPQDRIHADTGLILRTERSVLFVIPWGVALDHRHHRHRLAPRPRPPRGQPPGHRLPARTGQPGPAHPADATPTSRASTPGCGRCSRASPTPPPSCPASTPCPRPCPGLVTVAGGKYTTYRVMAADAIDVAARNLPRPGAAVLHRPGAAVGRRRLRRRCGTGRERLAAETGPPRDRGSSTCSAATAPASARCSTSSAERPELATPLPGADTYLAAEVVYAAADEGALHLEDVLTRRTRHLDRDLPPRRRDGAAAAAAPDGRGAGLVGRHGPTREVEHYRARVAAERDSQAEPDDRTRRRRPPRRPTAPSGLVQPLARVGPRPMAREPRRLGRR